MPKVFIVLRQKNKQIKYLYGGPMVEFVNRTIIDVYPHDWFYIHTSNDYDKTRVNITVNNDIVNAIDWVRKYKTQMEAEAKLRAENPAVATQYECYQAMLKLVKSDDN
jgi:hypothetical protein